MGGAQSAESIAIKKIRHALCAMPYALCVLFYFLQPRAGPVFYELGGAHTAEPSFDGLTVDHGEQNDEDADAGECEEGPVPPVTEKRSPERQQHGAEQPAGGRNDEKIALTHMAESEEVAENVLGESRNEEHEKGEKHAFVLHHIVITFDGFSFYDKLDKRTACEPGEHKRHPRAQGKSDGRIEYASGGPEKHTADKTGHLPGNGRRDDLQRLQPDENQSRVRAMGVDEVQQASPVREIFYKSVGIEKIQETGQHEAGQYNANDG